MEPTMRAAAKSTFMLRSERRSIHRQQQERSREPGPEKGVDTRCARVAARARGGPGPEGGLTARGAGHYPPAPPGRVVGAAAGGAEGVCHVTTLRLDMRLAPPAASRRCAEDGVEIGLRKKDYEARHALRPVRVCKTVTTQFGGDLQKLDILNRSLRG